MGIVKWTSRCSLNVNTLRFCIIVLFLLITTRERGMVHSVSDVKSERPSQQIMYVAFSMTLPACFLLYKSYLYMRFKRRSHAERPEPSRDYCQSEPQTQSTYVSQDSVVILDANGRDSDFSQNQNELTLTLESYLVPLGHIQFVKPLHTTNTSNTNDPTPYETWLGSLYNPESQQYCDVVIKSLRNVDIRSLRGPKGIYRRHTHRINPRRDTFNQLALFKSEICIHARVHHPQIATFYGFSWSHQYNLLSITEYVAGGNLQEYIYRSKQRLSEGWNRGKLQLILDVASALAFLHAFNPPIIHCNCNAQNILLTNTFRAKLSDCGKAYQGKGMPALVPEALIGRNFVDAAFDIFCYGNLVAELDTLESYSSSNSCMEDLHSAAIGSRRPRVSVSCPSQLCELVERCTVFDSEERIKSCEIVGILVVLLEKDSLTETTF